jgi:hypothetical protein
MNVTGKGRLIGNGAVVELSAQSLELSVFAYPYSDIFRTAHPKMLPIMQLQ